MATELTLHTINHEPRVLDTYLAERLGYERPVDIRELIIRNSDEVGQYGIIRTARKNTGKRGRPATAYSLNEGQALLICMFSKTANAALLREPTPSDTLKDSEKRPPLLTP